MAIDVVCPNGHRISVPEQFVGKSGPVGIPAQQEAARQDAGRVSHRHVGRAGDTDSAARRTAGRVRRGKYTGGPEQRPGCF